ncbi:MULTISPECIES: dihydrofolate reductase family protein [Mumia]|uniref:dihydrofolate reductase family protein n=1 Tax=Mumia TaxID=1546255 RepID=UPI001420056C|nr:MULTISPECIES: dihydrofolate reductase [unclassified Mumia]QMW68111.1 dihydrofolate reductase family protein [Mumia sp. ZJ1417]
MRRLTYFIALSIDGMIAGPNDEFDFYPSSDAYSAWMLDEYPDVLPAVGREQLGLTEAPNRHFDTIVMGRRTYEPGLALGMTSPYPHLRQYVVSTRQEELADDVTYVREDPVALVKSLKAEDSPLDIYLCGGGLLAATLLPEIDRMVVKRYPVVAGAGISAFGGGPFAPTPFDLTDLKTFPGGNAVLTYDRT